jgi:hypothetical protein
VQFHYFGYWSFHEVLIMRFHYEACVWQVWQLFQFGTVTPPHPLPASPHTYKHTHTHTVLLFVTRFIISEINVKLLSK